MRCYDLSLLQLLLGAALCLLLVQARSLQEEELQQHALSGQENGSGDEVTSLGATKDENSKEPVKKASLTDDKKKFDPDDKERKRNKAKSKGRTKRATVRQKGRPLTKTGGRNLGTGDLGSQISRIIEQFSAEHKAQEQDHSGGVGVVISALSDVISQSQQQVEDQVTVLREENNAHLAAVVAAVNQSAYSLSSLAETAEETHGFLQTIANSLGSINAMLHKHVIGRTHIGTPMSLLEIKTDTASSPDANCTGFWERVGSDCVYISSHGMPWMTNRPISKLSWWNAREACQNEGGALLEPANIYTLYDYLKENNLNHDYWLGGSDLNDDGDWNWVSGRAVVSDAWSAQPRRDIYTNCLNFSTNEVLPLSSGDCEDLSYYLCQQKPVVYKLHQSNVSDESILNQTTERPRPWSFSMKWSSANVTERPEPQESCEEPSFKVGSECFLVVDEEKSWQDARSYCQAEGYDLAEPENIEMLRQHLQDEGFYDDYWLGGTDEANEDEWLWLSGRPISGEWMNGQPSNDEGQNCLDFQSDENPYFNDYFCTHEQNFICEREPMQQPAGGGSMAVNATTFFNLLQGIISHPELGLVQNETKPSKNVTEATGSNNEVNGFAELLNLFKPSESTTESNELNNLSQFLNLFNPSVNTTETQETTDANNELNNLFQFLNLFNPSVNTTETQEATGSNNEVNGFAQLLNLFKPSESTTESPGDEFSNNMNGFLQSITHLFEGAISQAAGWCGPPLKLVGDECFFISDELVDEPKAAVESELTWSDAQEFCRENGGDLAEPSDLQALSEIMTDGVFYWVGSKYNESEATWKWVAGKNVPLSKYSDARPGICGMAIEEVWYGEGSSVGLDSDVCEKSQRWICEKPNPSITPLNTTESEVEPNPSITPLNTTESEVESCMSPYQKVGSQCLYIGETDTTWQEAQERCRDLNGSLAEITQEQNTVIDFLSSKAGSWSWAWIARTSISNSDEWLRSQTSVRGRWVEVPDDSYEGCLQIGVEYGGYKPYNCMDGSGHYICERKVISTDIASEPPYMSIGNELFLVRDEKLSWSSAQRDCQRLGGYLAEPQNITALRNYLIENKYEDDYWIGGSDEINEGSWIWKSSGNPILDDWMEDQPSGEERQNCLDFQPKEIPSLNDYSCEVTQKYICQKPSAPIVTETPSPQNVTRGSSDDCGNYTRIGTELFLIVKEKLSWPDAREYCKQNCGDLASPKNLDLLKNYVKEEDEEHDYWLGGTDEAEEGTWTWLSGERIVNSWKANQPSGERTQNCLDFRSGHTPSLNDYECDEPQYFICGTNDSSQRNPTIKDCIEPYFQIGNECFLVVNEEKEWHFAKDYCQNRGDHLAVPANPDKLADYLQENQLFRDYWLGATDEVKEGTWISVTGDSIIWPGKPPLNQHKNCLDFRSDRTQSYHDYFCNNQQQFLCERNATNNSSDPEPDVTTMIPEESCGDSYVLIGSECFKIVHYSEKNWDEARDDCLNYGGDLAMPSNITKLITYLTENEMTGDYWLGGSDIDEEGTWLWLSGEEITSGWSSGTPRTDDTENCLDFRTGGLSAHPETPLHDYYCSSSQKYICEETLKSTPDPYNITIETSQCTIHTFIGLTRRLEIVETELTLIKEYGRSETVNVTNEDSHTFKGVEPGHYTLCVHSKVASNQLSQSNCSNVIVEGEVPGIPRNVRAIRFPNGTISVVWDAPDDSSCPANKYRVQLMEGLHNDIKSYLSTENLMANFDDVIPGEPYSIRVNAENAFGEGNSTAIILVGPKESCEEPFFALGEMCYQILQGSYNWFQAQQLCQEQDADLVKNHSLRYLHNYLRDHDDAYVGFWMGALDENEEGNWEWISGKPISSGPLNDRILDYHIKNNCTQLTFDQNNDNVTDYDSCFNIEISNIICEKTMSPPKENPFILVGDEEFLVVNDYKTWENARTSCKSFGGDLAEPKDLELLKRHLSENNQDYDDYWIGGSDIGKEGSWKWLSGAVLNMSLFIDGEPSGDKTENCLDFQPHEKPPLNDYECDDTQFYICEKASEMTSGNKNVISDEVEGCILPFVQLGSECLLIIHKYLRNWQDARDYCQRNDADLAIVNDVKRLRKYLVRNDIEYDYWVGGSQQNSDGEWLWVNGDPFAEEWRDGEPDNSAESKCIDFQSQYRPSYNAYKCSEEQSFICEKSTISGKSVYDNKDKHQNNDLSSNLEKTDSLDESTEDITVELGTTIFPMESTDYYVQ